MFKVITAWLYAGVGEPVTSLRNTTHSFHSCAFQQGLRESTARCRSLEEQLLSLRLSEGEKDCQLKELECSKRALDQEIQSLKLQVIIPSLALCSAAVIHRCGCPGEENNNKEISLKIKNTFFLLDLLQSNSSDYHR